MKRINAGNVKNTDSQSLKDIITTMTDSSLCGLGQTAGSAIGSAMKKWPELFTPVSNEKLSIELGGQNGR
jgi:NADH-quinone oxidoreductase subunit F